MKKYLPLLLIPLVGFLAWYGYKSVRQFEDSEYDIQGYFICNKENTVCELSQHIHADIDLISCGQHIDFPKEKGNTNHQHTHKELNKIHWHTREKVDPNTREPLDKSLRTLGAFLEEMEFRVPGNCGKSLKPIVVRIEVNGVESTEGLDYIWKDGDRIKVSIE